MARAEGVLLKNNELSADYAHADSIYTGQYIIAGASNRHFGSSSFEGNILNIEGGSSQYSSHYFNDQFFAAYVYDTERKIASITQPESNILFKNNTLNISGKGDGHLESSREYFTPVNFAAASINFSDELTKAHTFNINYDGNRVVAQKITLSSVNTAIGANGAVYLSSNSLDTEINTLNVVGVNNEFVAEETHFVGGNWAAVMNSMITGGSLTLKNNVITVRSSTLELDRDTSQTNQRPMVSFSGVGYNIGTSPSMDNAYDYNGVYEGNGVKIINVKETGADRTGALGWVAGAIVNMPSDKYRAEVTGNYVYIENSRLLRNKYGSADNPAMAMQRFVVAGALLDNVKDRTVDPDDPQYTLDRNYVHLKNSFVDAPVYGAALVKDSAGQELVSFTALDADNYLILEGHNEVCYADGFKHLEFRITPDQEYSKPAVVIHNHELPGTNEFNLDNHVIYLSGVDLSQLKEDLYLVQHKNPADPEKLMLISAKNAQLHHKSSVFLRTAVQLDEQWDGWLRLDDIPAPAPDPSASTLQHFLASRAVLVNQGGEFVANEILNLVGRHGRNGKLSGFAALQSGDSNYSGKMDTDLRSTHLMVGFAQNTAEYNVALFSDMAVGKSDDKHADAKTNEDLTYVGLGVGGQYRFDNSWFIDGSVRAGYSKSKFEGSFQVVQESVKTDVDLKGYYVGGHVGVGYNHQVSPHWTLTPYARIQYNHVDGDSADMHEADKSTNLKMESVHQFAGMLGLAANYTMESMVVRTGLGYEWSHFSDAVLKLNNVDVGGYDDTLNNVVMEFALHSKENDASPWRWHAGIKGYAGDRQGVSAQGIVERVF